MKIKSLDDFVGIFEDVYPEGYCEHFISEFDRLESDGISRSRKQSEDIPSIFKDDQAISFDIKNFNTIPFLGKDIKNIFFDGLQACFESYITKFSILDSVNIRTNYLKVQKTYPGGGYHVWHYESAHTSQTNRILTYILYLNDLDEEAGGETELLYQRKRIKCLKNSLIIFPTTFTHTHRGNLLLGNDPKYIATGWFYLE